MKLDLLAPSNVNKILTKEGYTLNKKSLDNISHTLHDHLLSPSVSASSSFSEIAVHKLPTLVKLLFRAHTNSFVVNRGSSVNHCYAPMVKSLLANENLNLGEMVSPKGKVFGMYLPVAFSFEDDISNRFLVKLCEDFKPSFPSFKDESGKTTLDYLSYYSRNDIKPFLEYLALTLPHVFLQEKHEITKYSSNDPELKPNMKTALRLYENLRLKQQLQEEVVENSLYLPNSIKKM